MSVTPGVALAYAVTFAAFGAAKTFGAIILFVPECSLAVAAE